MQTSLFYLEQPLNDAFIKISVSRQVFSYGCQNHTMSYKTTYDIRAEDFVYRKNSQILEFHF